MSSSTYTFISHPKPLLDKPPPPPPHHHASKSSYPIKALNFNSRPSSSFVVPRHVNLVSDTPRLHANKNSVDQKTNTHNDSSSEEADAVSKSSSSSSSPSSFLSFLCPLLKLFSGGDPSRERNYLLEEASSSLSSLVRLPWGSRSLYENSYSRESSTENPLVYLQLFEFEACPFCRRVREAITELDLSVEIYPCPKGSLRHREMVRGLGGKEQFPFLIDPNTGASLYESGDIVKYLFQKYGEGRSPSTGLLGSTLFTGWVPTLLRAGRGLTLWEKSRKETPPRKLELFSYENSPNARLVREVLCEMELPYVLHSAGEGSARIKRLLDMSGSKEVPYLVDPNTGAQIGDYKRIISYLLQTYSMDNI